VAEQEDIDNRFIAQDVQHSAARQFAGLVGTLVAMASKAMR
jgi:hypothetical protein